jgi:hypothetical protein
MELIDLAFITLLLDSIYYSENLNVMEFSTLI